jgi:hypothetical protein
MKRSPLLVSLSLALSLSLGLVAGCNVIGLAAYRTAGPTKVPPKFKPAPTPMVVLAESYRARGIGVTDADALARYVSKQLDQNKVAPVVSPETLLDYRSQAGSAYERASMASIGRAVGARQVIYVELVESKVDAAIGSNIVKGSAAAKVRVIDADTGTLLWPTESGDGYPLSVETPPFSPDKGMNEINVRDAVLRELGDRIAKLFYEWQPEDEDARHGEM